MRPCQLSKPCRYLGQCVDTKNRLQKAKIARMEAIKLSLRLFIIRAKPPQMNVHLPVMSDSQEMHVLIIGAGIVGLTLAQGCKQNNIPFTLFERDQAGSRAQGWGLTLHWCLTRFEETIGSELTGLLPTVSISTITFSSLNVVLTDMRRSFLRKRFRKLFFLQLCNRRVQLRNPTKQATLPGPSAKASGFAVHWNRHSRGQRA